MRVRVLFTTPYNTASVTGVGLFVRGLAARLESDGGKALIVEPGDEDDPQGLRNVLLALRSAWAVLRRRRDVDVIHCQALHLQSLVAAVVGRLLGKKVVLTVHGPSTRQPRLRSVVLMFIERACIAVPHRLVLVAGFLRPLFTREVEVILNGVPVEAIRSSRGERGAVRQELGIADAVVLMYVGRVTADKGFWTLLEGVDLARRNRGGDVRLVCVGPVAGDVQSRLEAHPPSSWVTLVGSSPNPWRYLAGADAFILPSTREGLPLSLLEAMAAGLPTVATLVGGIPEVLEDGVSGRLVPVGDARALAEAVGWIVDHPEEARKLGDAAAELAATRYDAAQMWTAYSRVYANLVR